MDTAARNARPRRDRWRLTVSESTAAALGGSKWISPRTSHTRGFSYDFEISRVLDFFYNQGVSFWCQKHAFTMFWNQAVSHFREISQRAVGFGVDQRGLWLWTPTVGELGREHVPRNMEIGGVRNDGIPFFGSNLFELTEVVFWLNWKGSKETLGCASQNLGSTLIN